MRNAHQLLRFFGFNGMHLSCWMHVLAQIWRLGVHLAYQGLEWKWSPSHGPSLYVGDFYIAVTGRSGDALIYYFIEAGTLLQMASEYMAWHTLPPMHQEQFKELTCEEID